MLFFEKLHSKKDILIKKQNRFAAIDLGSTNCRLVIVDIIEDKYKIICSFSEILNLGRNLSFSNEFNDEIIEKTIEIFKIISQKLKYYNVLSYRCVATEACRQSINSDELVKRIHERTNIEIEIIPSKEEARLCLKSCLNHNVNLNDFNLVFDIGGGSTEIIIFDSIYSNKDFDFLSIPIGVINFSEKVSLFKTEKVLGQLEKQMMFFSKKKKIHNEPISIIGSCGTVTTLCAIHLKLNYYQKSLVDNTLLEIEDLKQTCNFVKRLSSEEKEKHPCIGPQRINLLDNGILILEKILESWPVKRILVSDRGLREGIILDQIKFKRKNEKNKT